MKLREDEMKNKYNNNYNYDKEKYIEDLAQKELYKEIIRNNKIKMKKFSNIANKVNIEIIKRQRKINFNYLNKEAFTSSVNNEIGNEGKFIPYSKYKEYELN